MNTSARILVVEDDQPLNEAYGMILESAGYEVVTKGNGQEALEYICSGKYASFEVILLDLRMPVLDGVGFLRKFDPEKYPDTTVVVFSNYDNHDEVEQAYALGAHKYILKAQTAPKELLKLVADILSESK